MVELLDTVDYGGKGVWHSLLHLPYPFFCYMGGAENNIEGLKKAGAFLLSVKSSRRGRNGCRADLGLARTAFRHDQPHFVALELPLDGLRHRKLGVVEGIARVVADVLIDCQHFRGKRFFGGIEQRNKKVFDPLGHRNAEGVQIVRYRLQFVQRGGAGDRARYSDGSVFQAAFQNGRDVFVLLLTAQQPRLHLAGNGFDPQGAEDLPPRQFGKNIVLKLRDQRNRGFLIDCPEQIRLVAGRAEDVGVARRQIQLGLRLCRRIFRIIRCLLCFSLAGLSIVLSNQGRLGVHPIVAEDAPVLLGKRAEGHGAVFTLDLDGNSAIDRVCETAHFLRVSPEPQGRQGRLSFFVPYHCVRVSGQPDAVFFVVVGDFHEFLLVHA